jgi:hypothetical protein
VFFVLSRWWRRLEGTEAWGSIVLRHVHRLVRPGLVELLRHGV